MWTAQYCRVHHNKKKKTLIQLIIVVQKHIFVVSSIITAIATVWRSYNKKCLLRKHIGIPCIYKYND